MNYYPNVDGLLPLRAEAVKLLEKTPGDPIKAGMDLLLLQKECQLLTLMLQPTVKSDFSAAPAIHCYKPYLKSILLNLLTNSIKYAQPGRKPAVNIITWQNEQFVAVIFSDNGRGMNINRVRNKIFGLYQRFHAGVGGRGLGLFFVHAQVIACGGTIAVCSVESEGTTFTIQFKKHK